MNFIKRTLTKSLANISFIKATGATLVALLFAAGFVTSFIPTVAHADALTVSCSSNPTSAYTGDSVSYYATAAGGNGTYTYSWTGTDNLYGTGSSLSHTYNTTGQQSATVTVNSNGTTRSTTCYTNITQRPYNYNGNNNGTYNGNYTRLSGSCLSLPQNVNTGDNVNWMAQNITGGNGSYTYYWTGTDGLSSSAQNAYKSYTYSGTKTASVTIMSGDGQSFVASCPSVNVNGTSYNNGTNNGYNNGALSVSCYASPHQANMFDSINWYATVTGGNSYYTYSWTGTDGLSGSGQNVTRTYSNSGQKVATITVSSNGQTVSNSCTANVGNNYSYNNYSSNNNTYSSGGFTQTNSSGFNNSYYPSSYNSGYTGYSGYTSTTVIHNPTVTYTTPVTKYTNTSHPISGVFLNQVPSTGISFGLKIILFILGLVFWSLFAAYIIAHKKSGTIMSRVFGTTGSATAKDASGSLSESARLQAFKKANLAKKGNK